MLMKNVSILCEFHANFLRIYIKIVQNSYEIETFFIDIVLSYKLHAHFVDWDLLSLYNYLRKPSFKNIFIT